MIRISIFVVLCYTLTWAISGKDMVNQYGCMECHDIKQGKTAPAFEYIAKSAKKDRIMRSIKNGSKGKYKKFTQNIMPEFDYFSNNELNTIAEWIGSLKHEK